MVLLTTFSGEFHINHFCLDIKVNALWGESHLTSGGLVSPNQALRKMYLRPYF